MQNMVYLRSVGLFARLSAFTLKQDVFRTHYCHTYIVECKC